MSIERSITVASPGQPPVSICIPVLNGGELVLRAVRSALEQTYPRVEVVVVDDASTDSTADMLRAQFGNEIKLFCNRARSGQAGTTNAAIWRSTGALVKFLHHDDQLVPSCVSEMVAPFTEHPNVGFAFCRRRIELDGLEVSPEWLQEYSQVHRGFTSLRAVNHAPALFEELLRSGLRSNWIGEPSSVMVRRACLEAVGGLSDRTRHWTDFDLWLRLLVRYDAAFVDRELNTYRRSNDSLSARNGRTREDWLDRLWMIENLMADPAIRARYPELADMRGEERRWGWKTAARGLLGRAENSGPPGPWLEYLGYRFHRRLGNARISDAVRRGRGNPAPRPR
jgi:glycosyltransferase involved in cell wall biosynthesis